MKENFCKLTLVTNKSHHPTEKYLHFIRQCVNAGITTVQLREKGLSQDLFTFGRDLKNILDSADVQLIVNDHVDLCMELDAAGVHLGQKDGDIIKARKQLGPNKIIGLSVNSIEQIEAANHLPIDYIGLSAVFPSKTKPDVEKIWTLNGLVQAAKIAKHPIVGIGGITLSNAYDVLQAGAYGIAAIGVFHDAANPYLATQNLMNIINECDHERIHSASHY